MHVSDPDLDLYIQCVIHKPVSVYSRFYFEVFRIKEISWSYLIAIRYVDMLRQFISAWVMKSTLITNLIGHTSLRVNIYTNNNASNYLIDL